MNDLSAFLAKLKTLDIKIWVDEGQLRVNGPDAAITPSLVAELQSHKPQLLALLARAHRPESAQTITPVDRTQPLLLSFAQQRLWFLDQLGSGFAYNIPGALQLVGPLNVPALQQALQAIVQRHESLRTTFGEENGIAYQQIQAALTVELPIITLVAHAPTEQMAEAQRLIAAEATRPFDLRRDPMLRATLLQLTAAQPDDHLQSHHILLLTLHHIAADGWSMGILVQELAALYTAFSRAQPPPLSPLPIQYADFALWQRGYLQGEVLTHQLRYWTAQLAGAPELLQLPTDRPRPAQQSYHGRAVPLTIDAALTQQLRRFSQQQGVTLYMTLLAAFQVLMARYSGQTDVVVGSPIANRNRREIEPLIGFFVNTLALRADLSGAAGQPLSFLELLAQVQERTQSAYDHQDLPFERLVEELQPDRKLNYNPLVQVSFALQNAPIGDLVLPELAVTPLPVPAQSTRFDLEVELFETGAQIGGHCVYNSDIFDESTIQRLAGHYQVLLAGIVADPQRSVAALPLLTVAERHQLLVEWNQPPASADVGSDSTVADASGEKWVHQRFAEQSRRTPDAIALVFADDQPDTGEALFFTPANLTYRELNERANQLAHHLLTLGARPGTAVGVALERSPALIVSLLAILKAGCVYIPFDPAYPESRLQYMVRDSAAEILLTTTTLAQRFAATDVRLLLLDQTAATIAQECRENIEKVACDGARRNDCPADPLAYVIYTSGSTGEPKGVMIGHAALATHIRAATARYAVTAADSILQFASTSFDVSLEQIFLALCNGAKVVLRGSEIWTPAALDRHLLTHCITVLNLPPAYFHQLLQHWSHPTLQGERPAVVASQLRLLLVGGEKILPETVRQWQDLAQAHPALQQIQFLNVYGPTETTITATAFDLAADRGEAASLVARNIPIGRPLANRLAYILDAHLQPTPVGVPGELHIGGLCLARGYLNRPQLTAEKFIPNPFVEQAIATSTQTRPEAALADRLYKTGDRCRYLPNGTIEFLGRVDNQVKVQGFRIELGEIESVLRRHPAIQDAVVLARQDQPLHQQLVAYLVAEQVDNESAANQVQSWQSIYEETYGQTPAQVDLTFNLTGWDSSYTGEPIPAAEMAEWVAETVADIRRLKPTSVWEIGCGTGLLLARLAPDCTVYWGTDYSRQALDQVERLKATRADLRHIRLDQRMADDFSAVEAGQFDCVILNSIIQYFPNVDYLLRVLEGAVRAVRPGGVVYVGDVRNLRLLQAYHAAVQGYQALDELPLAQLQMRIQQRMRDEEELLIDPAFFTALPSRLPAIKQVQIALKRGRFHNELTQFRYQVVLYVEEEAQTPSASVRPAATDGWQKAAWSQGEWTVAMLGERLKQLAQSSTVQDAPPSGLRLHAIPNARLQNAMQLLARLEKSAADAAHPVTVGQLRLEVANHAEGVDPEELWALAAMLPYTLQLTWGQSPGTMDAYFALNSRCERAPTPPSIAPPILQPTRHSCAWRDYTNNPLLGKQHRALVPQVRAWLQQQLPEYMIPAAYLLLAELPLTLNGKVDRHALPAPTAVTNAAEQILPRTPTEVLLATIWQEVLGLAQVGVTDNFFAIGGHSLLAIQIVSRIRHRCQVEVSLRDFFAAPTIAELSVLLAKPAQVLPPIEAATADTPVDGSLFPLSFAQQRLWILMQLYDDVQEAQVISSEDRYGIGLSGVYNMPFVLRLRGALDVDAFTTSWRRLEARHEALRTAFPQIEGQAFQQIHPPGRGLDLLDLSHLTPTQLDTEITRRSRQHAEHPFDLAKAPLWRATLVRLGEQEHLLLLTLHHIIADGWSMNILLRELATIYTAQRQDQPPPLPELKVHYRDYAIWQQRWLAGPHIRQQLDYWKRQLGTRNGQPLPILDLPLDFPRPVEQTFRGDYCQRYLPLALCQGLRALSQAHEATLFMTLCAALNLLLGRLAGQEEVLIGTPAAGRNRAEIENLIGFFVNTLVLRTDLSGNPTFQRLLERVRGTTLDAYDHQDLPFEKLIEELQPVRDLSRTPLFQVWFNMLPATQTIVWPDLDVAILNRGEPHAKFDLTFYVEENDTGIRLTAIYNVHLFSQARIEILLAQFHHLLNQIVQDPSRAIQRYSLCAPTDQARLPDPAVPLTTQAYPAIQTRFVQQAHVAPNALALVGATESFTYQELDDLSNQLAHYLLGQGVQTAEIVAIYTRREPALILALLGIAKAGATFMVLDAAYPVARLTTYCEKAQPAFLLTLDDSNAEAAGTAAGCLVESSTYFAKGDLCLTTTKSGLRQALKQYPTSAPAIELQPDQPLYVTFTSGSTGQPNAVVGAHRPVVHFVEWQIARFGLSKQDRFTLLSGLAHDPLLRDIFTPLSLGATLYIPDPDVLTTGKLAQWITQHGITVTHLTPQLCQILTAEGESQHLPLRYLFLGGDRFTRTLARRLQRYAPAATLVNGYGATETPQLAAYHVVDATEPTEVIPIGGAIEGAQLLVLNPQQALAGVGELGEIVVRTPYLATGYLHNSALTQARFIANPWGQDPCDRLYKTGDWGRYLPDGQVTFVGRADQQVKIRGFRVEPAEVEAVLRQHPHVHKAVVVARREPRAGDEAQVLLVAYVVMDTTAVVETGQDETGQAVTGHQATRIAALRRHLAEQLPSYMIPAAFVLLDALPLTPNGKVDNAALPLPVFATSPTLVQRPRTSVEQQLAVLWAETLGGEKPIASLGIHDSFFALGGHSLLAVQLLAKINQHFGQQLPLRIFFQYPTIAALADLLAAKTQSATNITNSTLVALQPEHGSQRSKPPFYCLPGAGGNVYYLYALAQALGATQPFYALEAIGLDGKTPPHTSIEAAAAYQVEILQRHQPHARSAFPYQLGGHSLGGVIAFAMAQQLLKSGAEVAPLILLDSRMIGTTPPPFDEIALLLDMEQVLIKEFDCPPRLSRAQLEPLPSEERLLAVKRALEAAGALPAKGSLEQIRGIYNVWRTNAQISYTPRDITPLPIHLFLAAEQSETAIQSKIAGWSPYGELTIHRLPGSHDTILYQPNAAELARELATCLASG